jgi:hypothetical protein
MVIVRVVSKLEPDGDVDEPDRGDRSHCGPDYSTIDGSRRGSELVATSPRAVDGPGSFNNSRRRATSLFASPATAG